MKFLIHVLILACLIISSCAEEEKEEKLLLKSGDWVERVSYDPNFAVFAYDNYNFKIENEHFILTLEEWVDYTFNQGCVFPQTVYVVGDYCMTEDSIYFEGSYMEPNLIDFKYNVCRNSNYYVKAFDYILIEDTITFRPTFWNVNFRERIEFKG